MSEIIIERLKNSIGKQVKIYLNNGFRYAGKLTNADKEYAEVLDNVSSSYKIIHIDDIKDLEVKE
jgi:small nuclear ribonucleoprotein (snRNP)-like protein